MSHPSTIPEWQIFNRVPNAEAITDGLKDIPPHWSLTPIQDKAPKRDGWEHEPFIPHNTIADLILKGERRTSKKSERQYTAFYSGAGLRTGEQSAGLLAIDVDGASAEPLLLRMSGGDIPKTVGWTSGKPGRRQIVFQIPGEIRPLVAGFGRAVVEEFEDLKTASGEQLEFRYSNHQSCLPPSRHPQTGTYKWVDSPADVPVAIAPKWLCDKLIEFNNQERQETAHKQQQSEERQRQALERRRERQQLSTIGVTTLEDVLEESLKRLHAEDIYNWSGHNWHYQGDKLLGCCPRHNSTSGKSFHVDTKTLQWFCFGCDVGGGAVRYRYFAQGGNGTPKGQDFVEILRGLASDAGVQMPERPLPDSDRHLCEPDPDAYAQNERMREIAEEAIYKELTQLTATPWKEVNTPTLDFESLGLEGGAIYIACSAKATGKTTALVPVTPKYTNVYAWFNRIALGREECNRIGVNWKDDIKAFTGSIKVGFCADSAYTFPPRHLKNNGLLLADEADQVFEHMFGDTCNKNGKRPMILAALQAQLDTVIAGNGIALFMSADITDKEVAYIQQLAPPGCPVRLIVNHYKPDLGEVYFNESDTPDGMIEQLLQDLESGQPRFVIDDLRTGVRGCKSIAEYIRKRHPEWANEIVEINSDTSGDPTIIGYLKNINIASKTTRLLCCSPSVVSGVSIENGHFTEVYAFLNGVMTVSHASQAIARVRGAKSINVWAAKEGLIYAADRSLFPEQIKGYYKRNYESNCKHLLAFGVEYDPLKDEWDSPHFDLYCKYAAYRNNCMTNLRRHLKQRLDDEGYEVFSVTARPSDVVKAGLEDAWATLEIKHAHAVAAANILTDTQLQALENTTLTPEQKLDVEKTYLLKAFGQELIDNTTFEHDSGEVLTGFAAMVLKDKRGEYRKQLEAFYLLTSDAGTAIAKDLKAEQRQLEHGAGRFAGDVRWHTRQRKARKFLELHNFLNPESWYGPADFAALAEKAKNHLGRVKDALGFAVGNMTAGQIFGELMGQLGLELNKKWATDRTKSGRRYKLRQINPDSWRYAQMYVTYRESLFTQDSKSPEPDESRPESTSQADHPSVDYLSKRLGGGDQGLSHTGHEIEVVSQSCFLPEILSEPDAKNPVNLDALAATPHHKVEAPTASPSIQARAVEILTRAGDWLRGYFYVGRKADRHQLADSTGYRGIFVDDNEFRFVEEVAA